MGLQISIRESGDVTILDLHGRSTIEGESRLLSTRLKELVGKGVRKLLLNLAGLTKVDSTGLGVIVGAYASLRKQGGELKLLGPCGSVLEVLKIMHLTHNIPCFEDETQALASFETRGRAAGT